MNRQAGFETRAGDSARPSSLPLTPFLLKAQLYAQAGRYTAAFDALDGEASGILAGLPSRSCVIDCMTLMETAAVYGHIDLIERALQALKDRVADKALWAEIQPRINLLTTGMQWSGWADRCVQLFCPAGVIDLRRLRLARYVDSVEDINGMIRRIAAQARPLPAGRPALRKKARYTVWLHNSSETSSGFRFFAVPMRRYLPEHGYEVVATVHEASKEEGLLSTGHLSNDRFCQTLIDRGVDIFIDHCGENAGCRYAALSGKPAPIMINLGGGLSSGLPAFDYRMADPVMANPAGLREWSSETLLIHPLCLLPYSPPDDAPPVRARVAGQPITFGNFNQLPKIDRQSVALWAEIMQRAPQARLRIQHMFASHKIAAERLEFRGKTSFSEHLDALNEVDIILDTTPFGGHTTCCEAMWMGKPLVNLPGDSLIVGRSSASYLNAAGHGDWVADTAQAYIDRALDWANAPDRLAELRQNGRAHMAQSPLCDGAGWVAHFARLLDGIVAERLAEDIA